MLKIKDNVNIEEVNKFLVDRGFYQYNDITEKYGHFKICKNRHIIPLNGGGNTRYDIIYDLIKADLVEKVED